MRRTLAALVLALTPPLTVLAVSAVQAQQVVTVRSGETLSEIADRHGVSLTRLMQANGITKPDHVEIGQRLTIPGSGSTARTASSSGGTHGTAPYTVKSGETLSEIADRFNTTTARLIQINRISEPDLVMSGTRLQVPVTAQRSAPAAASAPAVNRNASEHVVQSGENLSLIAERYGTSVSRLVALNQLDDPELVQAGTRLKLRGTPPAARSTPPTAAKPTPAPSTAAAQPKAAQPAPASAQLSGSATTPAATTAAITAASTAVPSASASASAAATSTVQPALTQARSATTAATSAATAATRSPLTTASAAAPLAAAAPTATTAATTSALSRSAPLSAASSAPAATRATPTGGAWRNYGPLQVDWSKIQPMGGSYVAPSLNSDGQPLYLAVNCTARKINVTSQAGQWRTWENPSKDFEYKLVQDICQANRS
jgi:LysM repeat protein